MKLRLGIRSQDVSKRFTRFACFAVVLLPTSFVQAQGTLAYSFEADLQGFAPNGGGVTVTQDTIGATDGTQSLKMDIVQGATFVGALTDDLDPNIFGDPPGVDLVFLDLTIQQAFPNEPGDFVDAGITVFGMNQDGSLEGLQAQFQNNQVSLGDLEVGTHQIVFELSSAVHPLTFASDQSFNDIFGVLGSGANDVIPTGFQFYINKSSTAPWTGYIDNIRFGQAIPGDFDNNGSVDGLDFLFWQSGGTDPPLDPNDLALWEANYAGGGSLSGAIAAVPEPGHAMLIMAGLGSALAVRRRALLK